MGIVPVMQHRGWSPVVALCLSAACTDWRSLYGSQVTQPRDASAAVTMDTMEVVPEADPPPAPPDAAADLESADADPGDGAPIPGLTDPIALWRFDVPGRPGVQLIPDLAPRAPNLPLQWDLNRDSGKTEERDGMLTLDGGFLSAGITASNALGAALVAARSFSIELWVKAAPTSNGTIFTTFTPVGDKTAGRAFAIVQKENLVNFSVHTTATDASGEHFVAAGTAPAAPSLARAHFPVEANAPIHVVALYSGEGKSAAIYVNAVVGEIVNHHRTGNSPPALVWAKDKYELGLGGAFDLASAWRGSVYLVAIYDRPLSADEIRQLYSAGPARM